MSRRSQARDDDGPPSPPDHTRMHEEHLRRALRHCTVDVQTEPLERALFGLVTAKVYPVAGDPIPRLIHRARKDPGSYGVRYHRRARWGGHGELRWKSI